MHAPRQYGWQGDTAYRYHPPKPPKPPELVSQVAHLQIRGSEAAPLPPPPPPPPPPPHRITMDHRRPPLLSASYSMPRIAQEYSAEPEFVPVPPPVPRRPDEMAVIRPARPTLRKDFAFADSPPASETPNGGVSSSPSPSPAGPRSINRHPHNAPLPMTPRTRAPLEVERPAYPRKLGPRKIGQAPPARPFPMSGSVSAPVLSNIVDEHEEDTTSTQAPPPAAPGPFLSEPWALSSVFEWAFAFANENAILGKYLQLQELIRALADQLQHHVPDYSERQVYTIAQYIISRLKQTGGIVVHASMAVEFTVDVDRIAGVSGVIPSLLNRGCYSHHNASQPGCTDGRDYACYSYACLCKSTRPIKNLTQKMCLHSWETFWNIAGMRQQLGLDATSDVNKSEIRRQHVIYEIISGELGFAADLRLMIDLFEKGMCRRDVPVVMLESRRAFLREQIFGAIPLIIQSDAQWLVPELEKRMTATGPFIPGIGDIFLEWVEKATAAYTKFSSAFPFADQALRQEIAQNPKFQTFLQECRSDVRTRRLDFRSFMQLPTQRLQRRVLLLQTVLAVTPSQEGDDAETGEHALLVKCLERLRNTCKICDEVLHVSEKTRELSELERRVVFKQDMHSTSGDTMAMALAASSMLSNETGAPSGSLSLLIDWPRRSVLLRGDLVRRSESRLEWLDTHVILLDNQLILTKPKQEKHTLGLKYYVSRKPIPLDLLVFGDTKKEPVYKSSSARIIGTKTTSVAAGGDASPPKHWRAQFSSDSTMSSPPPPMSASTLNASAAAGQPAASDIPTGNSTGKANGESPAPFRINMPAPGEAVVLGPTSPDKTLMFPFTIVMLGREGGSFEMFAPSSKRREDWISAIVRAKSARNLQNATRDHFSASVVTSRPLQTYQLQYLKPAQSSVARSNDAEGDLSPTAGGEGVAPEATAASVAAGPLSSSSGGDTLEDLCEQAFKDGSLVPNSSLYVALQSHYVQRDIDLEIKRDAPGWRIPLILSASELHWQGKQLMLLGTTNGVYLHEAPRLISVLKCRHVLQVEALEDLNLLLVLSDSVLLAYKLSDCMRADLDASNIVGVKLSGTKAVSFFRTGIHNGRRLIVIKKREGVNSVFTLVEPVCGKTHSARKHCAQFGVNTFRAYDRLVLPLETFGAALFERAVIAYSSKGFELMPLTNPRPYSVPNVVAAPFAHLRSKIESSRPLNVFKLLSGEYLCCYETCAVYMDRHGDVSRIGCINWIGLAIAVGDCGGKYVFALSRDRDMLEIWDALSCQLVQLLHGQNMRHLALSPHHQAQTPGILLAMSNPLYPNGELVILLSPN